MHVFQRELANRIERGRAVGNLYVVTARPLRMSGILATYRSEEERDAAVGVVCGVLSIFLQAEVGVR